MPAMSWEVVIGLEVHARLSTASKLFCACPIAFGSPPNTNVCPICLGYPGALPALNRRAVELALRVALASGCDVHAHSVFARKNYFYPDLPKGYQISQFERPLATGGGLEVGERTIRLTRIHIEEDAGKLVHESDRSLVDLNRSGTPLIEIVSEPDMRSSAEAAEYFSRLRQILMYVEACDGNMEEGSLRADANVSVRRDGAPLGTRAEVKNLNSFRFLRSAIEFEAGRQIRLLESGGKVIQETRLFDPASGETRAMRSKEEAHDYRYFPEPDLITLTLDEDLVARTRAGLPALPAARMARYRDELGIAAADADVLTTTRELADYFEAVVAEGASPRAAANWVRNEVLRVLNDRGIELRDYKVAPAMLARLITMIDGGAIGGKAAKEVFEEMSATGDEARPIVERKGLGQVSDASAIREVASRIIAAHPQQVTEYRGGKQKVFGFLVGQLMKEMRGRANAEIANQALRELLDQ
jgi:aspartyl-tRNA(Asn)/glutamyl-tRNA(Gln) amidotransferase subunit B